MRPLWLNSCLVERDRLNDPGGEGIKRHFLVDYRSYPPWELEQQTEVGIGQELDDLDPSVAKLPFRMFREPPSALSVCRNMHDSSTSSTFGVNSSRCLVDTWEIRFFLDFSDSAFEERFKVNWDPVSRRYAVSLNTCSAGAHTWSCTSRVVKSDASSSIRIAIKCQICTYHWERL